MLPNICRRLTQLLPRKCRVPRFGVVAPYRAHKPDVGKKVWQYDLGRGIISVGWRALGDRDQGQVPCPLNMEMTDENADPQVPAW